ncbi:uncharacterized protein LOC125543076 [Triticum urartu]|uniref:uncharacterized protein LOC125543076 n=1 Tax=Triticum urartu TaxID=4572 RepID=UPI002043E1CC|nr:uncharacterized protein LOC125543076 [Triticum urartu]
MAHEQELILKFDTMVGEEREKKEPTNLFEGWSDEEKVSYMRQLEFNLPQYSEAPNLEDKEVPDSVIFDVTDPEKIQKNYVASIGHYRSWQYVGSDRRFEFGSKQRTFVTRSTGTFVFYYRYKHFLVGLIVDGQCGWVEGAITRNVRDGLESVLQFARKGSSPDYIRSARTYTLAYDGNYTKGENISKIKIGIWQLCNAIEGIGDFVPGKSKSEPDPMQWQILILYGPEAGRINYIFDRTKMSLSVDNGGHVAVKIPADLEPFVLNYLKLSKCGIAVLDGKEFFMSKERRQEVYTRFYWRF